MHKYVEDLQARAEESWKKKGTLTADLAEEILECIKEIDKAYEQTGAVHPFDKKFRVVDIILCSDSSEC